MPVELNDFYEELFQEIHQSADADGEYTENAFFDLFCKHLVAAGDLATADRAQYLSPRGLRIDGYGGDPIENSGVLDLIIADYHQSQEIGTLTATDMNAIFKRATNFLTKALDPTFRNQLEETAPAFGLADLIAARWPQTIKVRILLISNQKLSSRVDGRETDKIDDKPVSFGVWDINRLHRFVSGGREREDIEIDLTKDFGGGLPALPAHMNEAGYEAYLIVIPGEQLAAIYDRWGPRLLEQNVRVFLQARGKVNKGLRITLENNPEMFFAYNNGITVTAESVETRPTRDGLLVTGFKNLQIVNGGQTTASIHAASKRKDADLSNVFVQMKLSIVEAADAVEVVPKISEYANSQNKVNAADFFANHPFHVRIEKFSRRMYVPSPDGTFRESKWFYERARGQYQDARADLTAAVRKKFDLEYPKKQMFTKTDLAKYLMIWRGLPEIVSKGAQKNFAEFARSIGGEWEKRADEFNELFYQHAIAKAIVFKRVEKMVTEQPWYEGGYRANIVAYAIAKLAHDAKELKKTVNFDTIWRSQAISDALEQALVLVAKEAHQVLVNPPAGMRNVTEWAKKEACWAKLKEQKVEYSPAWVSELVSVTKQRESKKSAVKEQRVLNGIEAQIAVLNAGGQFWHEVKSWGDTRKLLTSKEAGILETASKIPVKTPSEKQCAIVLKTLTKLQNEGCQIRLEKLTPL